jgi:hypothetical protein
MGNSDSLTGGLDSCIVVPVKKRTLDRLGIDPLLVALAFLNDTHTAVPLLDLHCFQRETVIALS